MKLTFMLAAMSLAAGHALALEGRITTEGGKPIKGAKINVVGGESTLSNQQGYFAVSDSANELHIKAAGFSHRIIHLHDYKGDPLIIRLAPTVIEQIDVIGLPIHASSIESALPVAVLSGEKLRREQAATLGDSLHRQPGVNSNFHGNVASTPIIRGLSGPRVLITQNSLDVSDMSRVGPDHAVASEVSTAQQIEILRGPATLFYGSGAIGGVVNVVDNRVPSNEDRRVELLTSYESINQEKLASFNGQTGGPIWAAYGDTFWREAGNYKSPEPITANAINKEIANSDEEAQGFTFGSSYLRDNGHIGIAIEKLDRPYGIPGHSHGAEADEIRVLAELDQTRYQLQSELMLESDWLRAINTRAAFTDYSHAEIEQGSVGTKFFNETTELRLDIFHREIKHWKGGVNLHYKRSDQSAIGSEAFTPPSLSQTFAVALMEERHFGPVLLQAGLRAERVNVTTDNALLPDLELHTHTEQADSDEHNHANEQSAQITRVFSLEQYFSPISVSVGAVWDFAEGYNLGFALSHAERAPSAAELFSFGPHIGTRLYEVGALFAIEHINDDEGNEESKFGLSEEAIALETSNNIDISFRKHQGDVGIIINAFYNKISDFYFQQNTGYFGEIGHDHDHGHTTGDTETETAEDEHAAELPIYLFKHKDAELLGLEAQLLWQINEQWKTEFFADVVNAELTSGESLPRTPPLRIGAEVAFEHGRFNAHVEWTHYAKQSDIAHLETVTDGYHLLDLHIEYQLPINTLRLNLFSKIENLTDEQAYVHTSFIKDIAPRPGRNFSVGLRGQF